MFAPGPDQLARRARAEDDVALVGVDEQLRDVLGQEGPVGLGDDDEIAARLEQAAPRGVAVALRGSLTIRAGGRRDLGLAVPSSALLSTTTTSSTTPVARKPSMTSRIESRSA